MAGKPVERPFTDILTRIWYWVIHRYTHEVTVHKKRKKCYTGGLNGQT